jgi:hypothetical protein
VDFLIVYAYSLNLAGQVHPRGISDKGKEKIHEGAIRALRSQEGRLETHVFQVKWDPPLARWAKLNTDAGFCQDTCMACIGVVVRDDKGKVILAMWRILANTPSVPKYLSRLTFFVNFD